MSSAQFSFFLTNSDNDLIRKAIFQNDKADVVELRTKGGHIIRRNLEDTISIGGESFGLAVCYKPMMNQIRWIEMQNTDDKYIDVYRTDCIEYTKCYVADNIIRSGRLYVVFDYWDEIQKKTKSDDFIQWSKQVFRDTKKHLKKIENHFYGPEAEILYANRNLKISEDGQEAHIVR